MGYVAIVDLPWSELKLTESEKIVDEKLKGYIRSTQEEIAELREKFREYIDDTDGDDLKSSVERRFDRVGEKLKEALEAGEVLTDKAQVKAHLGAMEARDLLMESKAGFEFYLRKAGKSGEQIADETELKAALAKMEAEDFWQEKGPALQEEFVQSAEKMKEVTRDAISDLRDQLKKWRG